MSLSREYVAVTTVLSVKRYPPVFRIVQLWEKYVGDMLGILMEYVGDLLVAMNLVLLVIKNSAKTIDNLNI